MIDPKVEVIHIEDKDFPESLRSIPKPPSKLYFTGDPDLFKSRTVGVVGSRKFTLYGKVMAKALGKTLAGAGISTVSGLAYGIDAFAHEGVKEADGKAIAVLGMGIDSFSPSSNRELFRWVCSRGLVISEYEPDFKGSKYSFPARNRLISGLSEKLVLVEAGFSSGALITARFAVEQGKDVYAVPGNINSQFSAGTNLMIRDGARPLIVLDDIVRDMGITPENRTEAEIMLEEDEIPIVNVIKKHNGVSANEISNEINMRVESVSAILTVLEIKGVIYSHLGKFHLAK